jgi:hypothetical protein
MTTTPRSTGRTTAPGRSGASLLRPVLLAVVAAAVAAAVTHLLFGALGADYVVEPPGQARTTVSLGLAAGVAAFAALVGGAVTVLVARRSRRPERVVVGLAVLGLLLFAVNPFLAAEQGLTIVALEVMHLAVAGAFVAVLLPALRRSPG